MGKPSRRASRRNRSGRIAATIPAPTSDLGFLNRRERRAAQAMGAVGEPESPIPCQCKNGHSWFAPGFFQAGVGTFFDDGDDRWCPICDEPEEFSLSLGRRPDA